MTMSAELQDFVSSYSIETTPGASHKTESYANLLPRNTRVAVTFLPGSDYNTTVDTCARLQGEGMIPVPHIAARSLASQWEFEDYTDKLRVAGAEECVVIAGAVSTPQGPYPDTMRLLETGRLEGKGFKRIGIAGHPEGSPDIPQSEVERAVLWKNEYAKSSSADFFIVTQFVFEALPIFEWASDLQQKGVNLPIHIGVPGLATIKTLINHARACGIGPSMRFVTRQARNVTRLMTVTSPDRLILDLSQHVAQHPDTLIRSPHFYPLGGLAKTVSWAEAIRQGGAECEAGELRIQTIA